MWWIVIAVAVALLALYKSPIRLFLQSPLNYLLAPAILFLALAWNLRAHLPSAATEGWIDLSFHFFGSSLLVAMFGLWPALVILFLVSLWYLCAHRQCSRGGHALPLCRRLACHCGLSCD